MRVVIQRVTSASVTVDEETIGAIERGLLVLLGVAHGDQQQDLDYVVEKTVALRIFKDDAGKMNRSVVDIGGAILVVSQFTLLADTRKGNRPSFNTAGPPELAQAMYQQFINVIQRKNIPVSCGRFAADMAVALVNDGPVTITIDSRNR